MYMMKIAPITMKPVKKNSWTQNINLHMIKIWNSRIFGPYMGAFINHMVLLRGEGVN